MTPEVEVLAPYAQQIFKASFSLKTNIEWNSVIRAISTWKRETSDSDSGVLWQLSSSCFIFWWEKDSLEYKEPSLH